MDISRSVFKSLISLLEKNGVSRDKSLDLADEVCDLLAGAPKLAAGQGVTQVPPPVKVDDETLTDEEIDALSEDELEEDVSPDELPNFDGRVEERKSKIDYQARQYIHNNATKDEHWIGDISEKGGFKDSAFDNNGGKRII